MGGGVVGGEGAVFFLFCLGGGHGGFEAALVSGVADMVSAGRDIGSSRSLSRLKAGESGASQHFFWQI